MATPTLLSATFNTVTSQFTLVWSETVTDNAVAGNIYYQRTTLLARKNTTLVSGSGTATLVYATAITDNSSLTDGTLSIDVATVKSVSTVTSNAVLSGFYVTLIGGPTAVEGAIGTYDEYMTVYKANANPITSGASQSQIQFLLDAVNRMAITYCGVQFCNAGGTQQTFTEYVSGTGSRSIAVRNPPITSITSITTYGSDGSAQTVDSTTYRFHAETGTIERTIFGSALFVYSDSGDYSPMVFTGDAGYFPEGFNNVRVIYLGGYTLAPANLRMAVYELVDEALFAAGVRGTDKPPTEDSLLKALERRLRPFERIVM